MTDAANVLHEIFATLAVEPPYRPYVLSRLPARLFDDVNGETANGEEVVLRLLAAGGAEARQEVERTVATILLRRSWSPSGSAQQSTRPSAANTPKQARDVEPLELPPPTPTLRRQPPREAAARSLQHAAAVFEAENRGEPIGCDSQSKRRSGKGNLGGPTSLHFPLFLDTALPPVPRF
jgi:hypothetical protein